jgi:hypothetical protein
MYLGRLHRGTNQGLPRSRCPVVTGLGHVDVGPARAAYARDKNPPALIPVILSPLVPPAEIPFAFRDLHAADLSEWNAGTPSIEFDEMLRALESLVRRSEPSQTSEPTKEGPAVPPPSPRRLRIALGSIAAAVIVALFIYGRRSGTPSTSTVPHTVLPNSVPQHTEAPYFLKEYRVGMKGGGGHWSQWMIFDLRVYPDGPITAPINLENDVRGESFCGSFKLELHDSRDNALLFSEESPALCIRGKSLDGRVVNEGPQGWTLQATSETTERFIQHPAVYGVRSKYTAGNWSLSGLVSARLVSGRLVPDIEK